jgi:hypothetical protein
MRHNVSLEATGDLARSAGDGTGIRVLELVAKLSDPAPQLEAVMRLSLDWGNFLK